MAESTRREAFGCKMQRQYADVPQTVWLAAESRRNVLSAYLRKSSDTGLVEVVKPTWPTYIALLVLYPVSKTSEMAAYGDS